MSAWEIVDIEKMDFDEQKKHYQKMIEAYQKELKKAKDAKKKSNKDVLNTCGWRAFLLAAAIGVFAGPAMMAFGPESIKQIGEAVSLASVLTFGGAVLSSTIIDDNGLDKLKEDVLAGKVAREQINEIQKKIKDTKKQLATVQR